jgi:hypothetical protein
MRVTAKTANATTTNATPSTGMAWRCQSDGPMRSRNTLGTWPASAGAARPARDGWSVGRPPARAPGAAVPGVVDRRPAPDAGRAASRPDPPGATGKKPPIAPARGRAGVGEVVDGGVVLVGGLWVFDDGAVVLIGGAVALGVGADVPVDGLGGAG